MAEKQTVYGKLAKARKQFLDMDVKKSGKNSHFKFSYYELHDIVPAVTKINNDLGLVTTFNIYDEDTIYNEESMQITKRSAKAVLAVVDIESGESIEFTSKLAKEGQVLNKGNVMQELGSRHTYLRRFLYLNAYDIVEADAIDSQGPTTTKPKAIPQPQKQAPQPTTITKEDVTEIILSLKNIYSKEDLKDQVSRELSKMGYGDIFEIPQPSKDEV
jgi:hypothetical protein